MPVEIIPDLNLPSISDTSMALIVVIFNKNAKIFQSVAHQKETSFGQLSIVHETIPLRITGISDKTMV